MTDRGHMLLFVGFGKRSSEFTLSTTKALGSCKREAFRELSFGVSLVSVMEQSMSAIRRQ